MSSNPLVDYLSAIVDINTGATLYLCGKREVELDLSFDRPSHSYELPGVDAPFDPYGSDGNPMSIRRVPFKWEHLYDTSLSFGSSPTLPATYASRRRDFNRAIGSGERVYGVLTDGDGKTWYGKLKLTSSPNRITKDRRIAADFDGVFELNPPVWRTLYPSGWDFLDQGLLLDNSEVLDTNTIPSLPLTTTLQSITVTNAGDAYERYLTLYISGPLVGLVSIYNTSIIKNGVPLILYYYANLGLYQTMAMDISVPSFRVNGLPAFDPTKIFRPKGQGDWFSIRPDANIITVQVAPAAITGPLSRVDVTAPGSYSGTPTVTITGGGASIQATAHAVMDGSGGVLSVILDTPGAGYTGPGTVGFSGGSGSGAAATSVVGAAFLIDSRDTRY